MPMPRCSTKWRAGWANYISLHQRLSSPFTSTGRAGCRLRTAAGNDAAICRRHWKRRTAGQCRRASRPRLPSWSCDADAASAAFPAAEEARGAGAGAGGRARGAAARRADQPPRHRRHRMAGRTADRFRRHACCSSPTTGASSTASHAHRRTRPRQAGQLPRQLRGLSAQQGELLRDEALAQRASSTSCWRRKRCGSARASRRGARATKAACGGWTSCAPNAPARRERLGKVDLQLDAGDRSGKLVAELKHVSKSFGDSAS